MKPEDLYKYTWLSDAAVNPQGKIAYVERTINKEKNNYATNICFVSSNGGSITNLSNEGKDTFPAWSPDGKSLAFLRDVDGKKQIFIVKEDNHAVQLTNHSYGIGSFQWSPCGDYFLFTARVPEVSVNTDQGRVYVDLPFKSEGIGLKDETYNHLFLIDAKEGECTQLTTGTFHISSPAWSPDGTEILYLRNTKSASTDKQKNKNTNDVFSINVTTNLIDKITDSSLLISKFNFLPNEKTLVLVANNQEFGSGTQNQLYKVSSDNNSPKSLLSPTLDLQIGNYALSDMKFAGGYPAPFADLEGNLYVLGTKHGSVKIYRHSRNGDFTAVTNGDKDIYHYIQTEDKKHLLYLAITKDCPGELYKLDLLTGEEVKLTNYHGELNHTFDAAEVEEFWFNSFDGTKIQGWIMSPKHKLAGEKLPLILQIHGGPHAMYTGTFNHEFQVLVSKGYSVMFINPRGSFGYGQDFAKACRGEFGEGDYQDIMSGLDYVLSSYTFVDTQRLGVSGGSYGGLMTNWIVSQTDRFNVATTHRSITNWVSFYGMSDIGISYTDAMLGGNPWENISLLWEKSPLAHVKSINTPLLILHGEEDLRCPVEQSDQLFTALKRWDRTTKLIRFPKSNHTFMKNGKPSYRIHFLEEVTDWIESYI